MSRRRPPRRPRPGPPSAGPPPVEPKADGGWHVRRLTGAGATSSYTCPDCHRPIPPGTPHVVVWPVEKPLLSAAAVDERRHWHTACWRRKP
ncbi:MAG: hypothetical protein EON53_04600 [Actinomycetales bacterium]|nr:MAG: hypothetical protein EON53_04600 [Actinomycetales bacterium]